MWNYEKRLQFPVNIKNTNAQLAQAIISQYGGPDGESAASMRYLSQRYTMPNRNCMGLLTDIATEELSHMEMICAIVYQLTCNLSMDEIEKSGFDKYYVDHTLALWPQAAGGIPFNACSTYDNILRLIDDPDVAAPIKFLREREIVHFQRFGEALRIVQDQLDAKNFYAFNLSFDTPTSCAVTGDMPEGCRRAEARSCK